MNAPARAALDRARQGFFHGRDSDNHWMTRSHATMVRTVSGCTDYDYLDGNFIADDVRHVKNSFECPLLVVHLNNMNAAYRQLSQLAEQQLCVPVLLSIAAPSRNN